MGQVRPRSQAMLLENTPRCAIVLLPARSRLNLNLGRNEIDLPAIPKTPVWFGMDEDDLAMAPAWPASHAQPRLALLQ